MNNDSINEIGRRRRRRIKGESGVRRDVDVADFTAVGFVGLNVNATVGVP